MLIHNRHTRSFATLRRRGFTLTEVLISVALVLIVILGINQVFGIAGRAVSAGQGLAELNREGRVAQVTFAEDLSHIEIDHGPFLIIRNHTIPAFRDKEDQRRDRNFSPTTTTLATVDNAIRTYDPNNDGNEILIPRALLVGRNHRTDQLIFFTRSAVRRQTGNAPAFVSDLTSTEAYVCYGHLRQPTNAQLPPAVQDASTRLGRAPGPYPNGTTTIGTTAQRPTDNTNNYYATQWILGRNVLVLRDPRKRTTAEAYRVFDNSGAAINFVGRGALASSSNPASRAPFSAGSLIVSSDETAGSADEAVEFSLCDVAGTTIERYRDTLMTQFAYPNNPGVAISGGRYNSIWWQPLVFRYAGFPTPTRPLDAAGVARTVPCFIPSCTQFIVEYAGDFLAQDSTNTSANYGKILNFTDGAGGGTDGEIDFTVVNGQRQIRWYGYPRDTGGLAADQTKPDGHIFRPPAVAEANVPDVIPLWATIRNLTLPVASSAQGIAVKQIGFPFERGAAATINGIGYGGAFNNSLTAIQNVNLINDDYATESLPPMAEYWCVWGPDTANYPRPQMLRITMVIDDPLNRTPARTFEYIIKLPLKPQAWQRQL